MFFITIKVLIMKLNKFIIVLLFFSVLSSCTKDFEEMNINPNEPSSVASGFLLTSVQKQFSDEIWDEWNNGRFGLLFAQYWSQNQYTNESRYRYRPSQNLNFWTGMYSGTATNGGGIQDLNQIIALSADEEDGAKSANQTAIARIMRAYAYHTLTDIYGPIPYSQANNSVEYVSPAYDSQEAIYSDLLKELTEASAQIVEGGSTFDVGDLWYGGVMVNWKKFANSLKLRVAMRMADVNEADAKAAVIEAVDSGVFTGLADAAIFNYGGGAPDNNPLNEDRKTRPDNAVSTTLVNKLIELNDPRLAIYADTTDAGTYEGMPYGLTEELAGGINVSAVCQPSGTRAFIADNGVEFKSTDVLRPEAPAVHMTYAEVEFLLAEAVQRGFISGDASVHYANAIAASMEFWGVPNENGAYANYLAANPYNASDWKVSLGTQKWLDMYMQGIQAWIEWRRLDFGILQEPESGVLLGSGIPVRLEYPVEEASLNGNSLDGAVEMLGGSNTLDVKVWWDVY